MWWLLILLRSHRMRKKYFVLLMHISCPNCLLKCGSWSSSSWSPLKLPTYPPTQQTNKQTNQPTNLPNQTIQRNQPINQPTPKSTVLLNKVKAVLLPESRNFRHLTEFDISLQCLQEPTTCPYPEPHEFSPYPPILLL